MGALGGLILAYLGVQKLMGHDIGTRPLLSLAFFLVLGGVQMLTTGILAELVMRVYYDVGRARPYRVRDSVPEQAPAVPEDTGWHA